MQYRIVVLSLAAAATLCADMVNPFNVRPIGLGGTWDPPAACADLGSVSCNLFDIMPAIGAVPWSMSNVGLWEAYGDVTVDFVTEKTAGAATQQIGIWSGVNAHPLFPGLATGGASFTVTPADFLTWGIDQTGFGFYLATDVNSLPLWMFTLDELNYPLFGGSAQALVFQTQNSWIVAFEDIRRGMGDDDYNDAVIRVGGISPAIVPEPSSVVLLGIGLSALAIAARRKSRRKGRRCADQDLRYRLD